MSWKSVTASLAVILSEANEVAKIFLELMGGW